MNITPKIEYLISLPGNIAECGVWLGDQARMMANFKGYATNLHLFDTFEGLPEFGINDQPWHFSEKVMAKQGDYAYPLENLKADMLMAGYKNIIYHKGLVQHTAINDVSQCLFNYVHIDLDLYEGTAFCLEFFYDRLTPIGCLSIHDYHVLDGVSKAVTDFCIERSLTIVNHVDTGVLIYK
jgi:O-methyltransferase